MKIQRRLTLVIVAMFAIILMIGIQSVSYVRKISHTKEKILDDN